MEAMKHLTPENLDSIAKKALDKGEPIPEWRDRETTRTGRGWTTCTARWATS
jgi:hypothetical protein